jgi:hypothetical protein
VEKQMQEDLASQYEQALRKQYSVKIHEATLNNLRTAE